MGRNLGENALRTSAAYVVGIRLDAKLLNERSKVVIAAPPEVAQIWQKSGRSCSTSARIRSTVARSKPNPGQPWHMLAGVAPNLAEVSPISSEFQPVAQNFATSGRFNMAVFPPISG